MRLNIHARNQQAIALGALVNGGTVEWRSGSPPASSDSSATGTLIATTTISDPAFQLSGDGQISPTDWPAVQRTTDDDVGYARVSNGDTVLDFSVTATGGSGNITIGSISGDVDDFISVTGGTITQPAGTL